MAEPWSVPLDDLRRAVLDAPADAAADVIAAWVADAVGGAAQVRLVDRAGRRLHAAGSAAAGDRAEPALDSWLCDGGPAADALWSGRMHREVDDGVVRRHLPLGVRGIVEGLLTVTTERRADDAAHDDCWHPLGELAGLLLGQASQVTDAWEVRRRSATFSVSAEFQWQLLPATSVSTPSAQLHALIEPAPRVTSDLFDWSLDGDRLWLAVLDAEGRSLSAALPSALAVAALRHARRSGAPVDEQVALADQAIYDQFRGRGVVRAVVVGIDLASRTAEVVRAGPPDTAPRLFRRRDGHVEELAAPEHEDLGRFDRSPYRSVPLDVAAGDALLIVTDGGPEARDQHGRSFGRDALVEHFTSTDPLAAVPRRLLDALREHSGGEMAQDATALVVGLGGTGARR